MSARFYKIFSCVFLAHLVVTNFIWVGFYVPLPRSPATFTYGGRLPVQETQDGAQKTPEPVFSLDDRQISADDHWIKLRTPVKPSEGP